jgi:ATP-dependent 26S proteasome regulatory subunit
MVLEDLETIVGDANRSFFLNELDGFSDNSGIVVLATTNYPERIDPAIIDRPSRFDRKYLFDLPSTEERLAFLERWARGLEPDMRPSVERLGRTAEKTRDFSFAYLKELCTSSTIAWVKTPVAGAMDTVLDEVATSLKDQVKQGRSPKTGQTSRRVGLIPEA